MRLYQVHTDSEVWDKLHASPSKADNERLANYQARRPNVHKGKGKGRPAGPSSDAIMEMRADEMLTAKFGRASVPEVWSVRHYGDGDQRIFSVLLRVPRDSVPSFYAASMEQGMEFNLHYFGDQDAVKTDRAKYDPVLLPVGTSAEAARSLLAQLKSHAGVIAMGSRLAVRIPLACAAEGRKILTGDSRPAPSRLFSIIGVPWGIDDSDLAKLWAAGDWEFHFLRFDRQPWGPGRRALVRAWEAPERWNLSVVSADDSGREVTMRVKELESKYRPKPQSRFDLVEQSYRNLPVAKPKDAPRARSEAPRRPARPGDSWDRLVGGGPPLPSEGASAMEAEDFGLAGLSEATLGAAATPAGGEPAASPLGKAARVAASPPHSAPVTPRGTVRPPGRGGATPLGSAAGRSPSAPPALVEVELGVDASPPRVPRGASQDCRW